MSANFVRITIALDQVQIAAMSPRRESLKEIGQARLDLHNAVIELLREAGAKEEFIASLRKKFKLQFAVEDFRE